MRPYIFETSVVVSTSGPTAAQDSLNLCPCMCFLPLGFPPSHTIHWSPSHIWGSITLKGLRLISHKSVRLKNKLIIKISTLSAQLLPGGPASEARIWGRLGRDLRCLWVKLGSNHAAPPPHHPQIISPSKCQEPVLFCGRRKGVRAGGRKRSLLENSHRW